jgi:TonB-dependent starch-binding outer membrane protein SusC
MKKNSTECKKLLSTYTLKIPLAVKLSFLLMFIAVFQSFAVDLVSASITPVLEEMVIRPGSEVQQRTITGKVTDNIGEPLVGVNIIVKGSTIGAVSDVNGNYTITVPSDAITLVFSFIGMETREETIGDQMVINMTLSPDALSMSEIVVVGYGTLKKSDVTGSLVSVSSEDFNKQPLNRIDQALQGRSAGVQVIQTSGQPGGEYKIRIRGANSISGSNDPLYVIDGMIIDNLNSLNVNDIQSIEILKDASATAIYGSRGANGVVLITSKSGKPGETRVALETFTGVSNVTKKLPVMNAADFAEGVNAADGVPTFSPQEIENLRANGGEDWQDRMFKQGHISNIQLTLSGGNEAVNYFISGNYLDNKGIILNQDYGRYNLRTNINAELSKKLRAGINIFGSKELTNGFRSNINDAITYDPTTPAFDENGNYIFQSLKNVGNASRNPLIFTDNNIREIHDNKVLANMYLSYSILDNLVLRVSGGFGKLDRTRNGYTPILISSIGMAEVYKQEISSIQNTNMLTYTWEKHVNHRLRVDAIHEQQLISDVSVRAEATNFFSDLTSFKNLGLGSTQRIRNESASESIQSYLGRVNYSLMDRYLLTVTLRADGASKFRRDQRWGYFPSASVAWRLSEEGFMQNMNTVNNLKLRASYGITGSQAIDRLSTWSQPRLGPNHNYPFTGQTATIGLAPSNRIANPDLTWEKTAQANLGLDLGMWASRFILSFDVYKKNTTDLLLDANLPQFLGASIIARNVGEVENKGFDAVLGLIPVENKNWRISTNVNLSSNRNKVLSLVDGSPLERGLYYYTNTFPVPPTRVEVGQPISAFRGYIYEGVYQLGEEEEAARYGRKPGDAKYRDINDDGLITTDDITTIGDGNPDFIWGWNTTISWKDFDLNTLVLGSHGNNIYNFTRGRMMSLGAGTFHAVHEDYKNRWTPDNPSNIPSGRDGTQFLSSQFLEDGSYVTIKNVSLGYTLTGKAFMNNIGLSVLKIYFSAENLIMLTNYRGFDPETTASGNSDVDLGIDHDTYPLSRAFTVGVNVNF